jgi:hypothetical protein
MTATPEPDPATRNAAEHLRAALSCADIPCGSMLQVGRWVAMSVIIGGESFIVTVQPG